MNTLPFDYSRCEAAEPDAHCRNCLRWASLPGQTWGERTPVTSRHNSTDEHCDYISINKEPT